MDFATAVGLIFGIGIIGYFIYLDVGSIVTGKLSASQIMAYAAAAGFSGDDLTTAVAVALAESSGDPKAVGDSGTSYGLWQIHFTVHPEVLNGADPATLFDPQTNANAAMQVFGEQGWAAWSTYKSGAYEAYLPSAQSAVAS